MFNDLNTYIKSLNTALKTPSKKFINIGLQDIHGNFKQLNTNILQMENELYTQIRPKRNKNPGESLLESLKNRGIEYLEIRSLDINPFSPIGISKNQILLLDLFLIWCALIYAPNIHKIEFELINQNWNTIIFEGRKPNQKLYINNQKEKKNLTDISNIIFKDLYQIALILDQFSNNLFYQTACNTIQKFFQNPELTYSAKLLKCLINPGIKKTGLYLAQKYYKYFLNKDYVNLNESILKKETIRSHQQQIKIEKEDNLSFQEYIKNQ